MSFSLLTQLWLHIRRMVVMFSISHWGQCFALLVLQICFERLVSVLNRWQHLTSKLSCVQFLMQINLKSQIYSRNFQNFPKKIQKKFKFFQKIIQQKNSFCFEYLFDFLKRKMRLNPTFRRIVFISRFMQDFSENIPANSSFWLICCDSCSCARCCWPLYGFGVFVREDTPLYVPMAWLAVQKKFVAAKKLRLIGIRKKK